MAGNDEIMERVRTLRTAVEEHLAACAAYETQTNEWTTTVPKELHERAQQYLRAHGRPQSLGDSPKRTLSLLEEQLSFDVGLLIQILQDPLEGATRAIRRNLDFAAATAMVGSCFVHNELVLLGMKAPVGIALGAVATLLLGYQASAFLVYVDADRRKLARAQEALDTYTSAVRFELEQLRNLTQLAKRTPHVEPSYVERIEEWTSRERSVLVAFTRDAKRARIRELWDLWLPLVLGGVSIVLVWTRALGYWAGWSTT